MRVLLTGATGFIGSAVAPSLIQRGHKVRALVRETSRELDNSVEQVVCDLGNLDDLSAKVFTDIDCVIHLAGRAHIMNERASDALGEYRKHNCAFTLNLARLCAQLGVKRFVFLSSIKVNGEMTSNGAAFKPDSAFAASDPYGISKYEAEEGLLELASSSGMEAVIIRPPLVYGPNVKGNLASMIRWVRKGVPLPFGLINNKRSLIALDNLVDFILLCADRKNASNAANQVFLISDEEDVSTSALLRKIAKAYGVKSRLVPVPVSLMRLAAMLVGRKDLADRLLGNLQVDSSKSKDLVGWQPKCTMEEQLQKMAEFDLSEVKS